MATTYFNLHQLGSESLGVGYEHQKPQIISTEFQCNNNQNGEYYPISHKNEVGNISTIDNKKTREKLGGQNNLVIIDSFPVGYKKFNEHTRIKNEDRMILGFAEISDTTPKYHFEALPVSDDLQILLLDAISRNVHPDSTIIVDDYFLGIYESLAFTFNTVVTVKMLERHNSVHQNVIENLKQIWHKAVDTCDNVHDIEEVELMLESICN